MLSDPDKQDNIIYLISTGKNEKYSTTIYSEIKHIDSIPHNYKNSEITIWWNKIKWNKCNRRGKGSEEKLFCDKVSERKPRAIKYMGLQKEIDRILSFQNTR